MKVSQLQKWEYPPYYEAYIATISNEFTLVEELEISVHRFIKFVQNIPMDKFDFKYAEGKWTIKDIIQHLIDCERILTYRALCFARNDKTSLPGFDENEFAIQANGCSRSILDLLTELAGLRQTTIALFKSFSLENLSQKGVASQKEVTVQAIGFFVIGHQNHHQNIFEQRYFY